MKIRIACEPETGSWWPQIVAMILGLAFGVTMGYLSNPHAYDWLIKLFK